MDFCRIGWVASAIFVIACLPARAEDSDASLRVYAVHIHRTPMQTWGPGSGIYLGKGLVITAAHVVGHAFLTRPKVIISGQEIQTKVIKEGSFETIDLTLLSIDEALLPVSLRLRRNPICQTPPYPGQRVISVVPEKTVRSTVISPLTLSPETRKFDTIIADVAQTGNSGSGLFDADKKCLLGIMSRKISETRPNFRSVKRTAVRDVAKYFVPAATIAEFIPVEFRD